MLGGGNTLTPDSPLGQALNDGSFIVYIYANSDVLTDMLTEVDGLTLGLSDLPKGIVSYIPTVDGTVDEETNYQGANDQGTHWWWVAGGIAVAAVGIKTFNDNHTNHTNHANTVKIMDLADTTPPTITINAITADNTINANEKTTTITGSVETGSTVTLSLAGNVRTATVLMSESGSTWSYTLTPADISAMDEGNQTITATATDTAGNEHTVSHEFTVDTTPPTIAIDLVATNDIINAHEVAAPIIITGTVVEAGSTVKLSLAGNVRTATVTGGTWSYTLTPADISAMGEGNQTITATATDTAGNERTVSHEFTVDTTPPTITINDITADNTINANEKTTAITGSVEADSSVTLSFAGNERTATVLVSESVSESGSTWSYTLTPDDISAMGQGNQTITATATDTAGNEHTASREITVDTTPPTITINDITADNTINANEVTTAITGSVEAGSSVSLSIAGNERTATVLVSESVSESDSTWSYTLTPDDISAMGEGAKTITATATDTAGNTQEATREITVDTVLPTIAINDITADNMINANEVTTTITGSVETGSTVSLSIAGNVRTATVLMSESGSTWSYTLTPADISAMDEGNQTITATATDTAGNEHTASHEFTVDTVLPTIDTVATDNTINAHEVAAPIIITGTVVEAGSSVSLSIAGNERTATVLESESGGTWSYTLTPDDISAMEQGAETITATDTAGNEHTASREITVDTQTVTIVTVSDDVSTHGSVVGNLATGATTDDTTPTLAGTLSFSLTSGQVLAVYADDGDGATKLGDATVTGTDWTYTPDQTSALAAGRHSFTAQVENPSTGQQSVPSNAHVINVNSGISMIVTDNVGAVTGVVIPEVVVRYILLKQTGELNQLLWVNEVEVFSAGVNIAKGKAVTAGGTIIHNGFLSSGVTDGNLDRNPGDGYASNELTNDNWLLVDLGINYAIDSVNVYALSSTNIDDLNKIKNVDVFASSEDLSSQTYAELTANANAINLGGTGSDPDYKTTLTDFNVTDDSTPTLSGTLTAALGAGEELAIYYNDGDGTSKLGVATFINGDNNADNAWTFTTAVLTDGSHTLTAVIQAADATAIASGSVISAAYTITVNSGVIGLAQASSAAPQEAMYSSFAASNLEATDISFSEIAATDPLSGMAVQTYSLPLTAKEQTLDFSGSHPEINVINIAGSGANTVKIDLDDVLQSGINLFNDANGWAGLDGADKHQLVVNGDADDTVELAGSWILAGTTTNSDHTYVVYHLDADNADGRSQVLIDQAMHVL